MCKRAWGAYSSTVAYNIAHSLRPASACSLVFKLKASSTMTTTHGGGWAGIGRRQNAQYSVGWQSSLRSAGLEQLGVGLENRRGR